MSINNEIVDIFLYLKGKCACSKVEVYHENGFDKENDRFSEDVFGDYLEFGKVNGRNYYVHKTRNETFGLWWACTGWMLGLDLNKGDCGKGIAYKLSSETCPEDIVKSGWYYFHVYYWQKANTSIGIRHECGM